jgi:hypothetical protein
VARRAPGVARAGYDAIAGRRPLLGRLVSDRAKERADRRIAQRGASS